MRIFEKHLGDIKDWLSKDSEVELPAMQRGFVWKPSQIENLWDSVFREFPMGSFLLTATGEHLMLIDGHKGRHLLPWDITIRGKKTCKDWGM